MRPLTSTTGMFSSFAAHRKLGQNSLSTRITRSGRSARRLSRTIHEMSGWVELDAMMRVALAGHSIAGVGRYGNYDFDLRHTPLDFFDQTRCGLDLADRDAVNPNAGSLPLAGSAAPKTSGDVADIGAPARARFGIARHARRSVYGQHAGKANVDRVHPPMQYTRGNPRRRARETAPMCVNLGWARNDPRRPCRRVRC